MRKCLGIAVYAKRSELGIGLQSPSAVLIIASRAMLLPANLFVGFLLRFYWFLCVVVSVLRE